MLSEWLSYLQTGLQSRAGDSFFPLLYGVFLFLQLLCLYRRFSILKTGGHFWDSYHITGDTLYIHAGLFCIGRRDVPFAEMMTVDIDYVRGKGGARFTVQIHREKGLNKRFVISADEKGKRQLKDLERALFQHRIAVRKWGY